MNIFSLFTQSCPTFCYPMDCNMPGFPVRHQLLELTLTHVHRVNDAIEYLMKYLFNLKYFSGTELRYKDKLTLTDPGKIDLALVAQTVKNLPTMKEGQV